MPLPKKARRDSNEPEIVEALRAVGATVQHLSATDMPDLLVGFRGNNYLIEVKMPKGKLKQGQIEWHNSWHGQKAIARSIEQALKIIGAID